MKPSEVKQKAILEFLSKCSPVNRDQIQELFTSLSDRFEPEVIFQELEEMDMQHEKLIQMIISPVLNGNPGIAINSNKRWLTSKGDDRLYSLTQPEEEKNVSTNFNFNAPVTANGQQTFGNIANQSVDNSIHISKTWNTDNSIHQLLKVKSELPDSSDQQTLEELARVLKSTMDSTDDPKPGFLSKFSGFLDKTWTIVSPVVAPFLVELAKRAFIG